MKKPNMHLSLRSLWHLVLIGLQVALVAFVFSQMYIFSQNDVAALHTLLDIRSSLFNETDAKTFDSNVFLNNVDLLSHATIIFGQMPRAVVINQPNSHFLDCLQYGDNLCPKIKHDRQVTFKTYYPKVHRWLTFIYKTQDRSPEWLNVFFMLFECLFVLYLLYYLVLRGYWSENKLLEALSGSIASLGHKSISQAKNPLKDVVKDKLMVLSSASHDIKTPLTRIKLLMESHQDQTDVKDRVNGELDKIVHCLNHVEQYIQTGEMLNQKQLKPLQFNSFMDVVLSSWQEHHAQIEYQPLDKQVNVYAHSKLLRRALDNVMKNAVDYAGSFVCRVTVDGSFVHVMIQDSGPGVTASQLETIFNPFVKGDHQSGTGLGLAITKRIIEAHRGDVKAQSLENEGLTVLISLPLLSVG